VNLNRLTPERVKYFSDMSAIGIKYLKYFVFVLKTFFLKLYNRAFFTVIKTMLYQRAFYFEKGTPG